MKLWTLNRTATETPPEQREAPPVEPPVVRQRPAHRWWVLAAALVAMALLAWWAVRPRRPAAASLADANGSRTATAERRDFVRTLRLHGVVTSTRSYNIAAPRLAGQPGGNMTITRLIKQGPVRRGELVVEFDNQLQLRTALEREVEHRDLEEQIKKKKAEHAAARARDETELKEAENALATAQLEMRKNEVISRIDAEKNQQNLEEATARLAQLRETFELKQRAREAELRILEIQRDRAYGAMLHARRNAQKMSIRSPMDGLAVLGSTWRETGGMSEIQEGDQAWPGMGILEVVNPAGMEVRARVNQGDFPYLRVGQPIQVRLDAYPDLLFAGRVARLAAVGVASTRSTKVRTFAAVFSVEGSDPKLLPDLSAAVDVEIERQANALVVPRDALFTENGQTYVEAKNGQSWERRAVKLGPMCDHEAVIASGLEAGAVVRRRSER